MPEDLLIDQALAVVAASGATERLGVLIPLTPEQGLVYAVYTTEQAALRGLDERSKVATYSRSALRAGIAQREIDAAIARANAPSE